MDRKSIKNIVTVWLLGLMLLGFTIGCIFFPQKEFSESERRYLAAFPEVTAESILSAKFMADFDSYTTDRFPLRDGMRGIKALASRLLLMGDNGGIYYEGDHIGKLEYPLREDMITYAADLFGRVYRDNIEGSGCKVYLSVVPDKNLYLAGESGRPSIDYERLQELMAEGMPYAESIDIYPLLTLDSYYNTDTHWRQERILPVAEALLSAMGAPYGESFSQEVVTEEFRGVLMGQGALPHQPDSITLLTNDTLENAKVFGFSGEAMPLYDMEKLQGLDPYEVYLSGVQPFVVMENPENGSGRELVIFRDSYGSSIAPLLLQGYSRVTLIDLRYMNSAALSEYIEFQDQDVLVLMSSLILNSANAMR